jgi:hypothetical protein
MAKRKEENMPNEQLPKTLEEALSQGWHWDGEIGQRSEDKKTFEGVAELVREGRAICIPCTATYEFGQVQTETTSPPGRFESATESDKAALVGDLMMAAQGAALLLTAAHSNIESSEWENVAAGLSVVLASLSNQVDARYFEETDISLHENAVDPRLRLCLLERQVAELREKIAEKQRGRA